MNLNSLHKIFQKYIDNFEYINNSSNDENYKWEIAEEFQTFDLHAPDFVQEMTRLLKASSNFIDNGYGLPFKGLIEFAKFETDTVRKMFIDLYSDDNNDLIKRQKKIDDFIEKSEELRQKYYPDSYLYTNNQKSAMQFLFLRYPNQNYTYKAVQAKSFADCVEFYDDWGPMTDFRLEVFYRMCDMLVEEIKKYPELVLTHKSRYENTEKKLHADDNLHILAFDIIYSSQVYNFYQGMSFSPINAQARKLHAERVAKAREYYDELEKAKEENNKLNLAIDFLKKTFPIGTIIKHKTYREGIIINNEDLNVISVDFNGIVKKMSLFLMVTANLIILDDESIKSKINEYRAVLQKVDSAPKKLIRAEEKFLEYADYLE